MYQSFHIKNFRGFRDLKLDSLERVNLIAGANNVGKTALLEAIFLHIGANNPELGPGINSLRGLQRFKANIEDVWSSIFNDYDVNTVIEVSSKDDAEIKRTLKISLVDSMTSQIDKPNGDRPSETLATTAPTHEVMLDYQVGKEDHVLSRSFLVDDEIHSERGQLSKQPIGFFLSTHYRNSIQDAERFSDLAVRREQDRVISTLQLVEPRLRQLSVQAKGGMAMVYGDVGTGRLIPIPIMGEGMSRLLSLTLGIVTFEHGAVLIDEVENGLHYSVMSKVWGAIAHAARASDVQIFATTHSWECITAAHEAFSASDTYDFRLHRLDRVGDDIRVVTYDQDMLDTAIRTGLEVR